MAFSFAISFGEQENDLLAGEVFLFEAGFGAVEIFDRVAFLELALQRLEHDRVDLPILIAANTVRDLRVLDANVRHYLNGFVVLSQVTQRRPVVVVLNTWTKRQHQQND